VSFLRSLRAQGTALLLGLVLAVGLVYGIAASSALRETQERVASERREQSRGLARRYDALLQAGAERLAAVAEQPGLAFWLAALRPGQLAPGAAIPQRETLHYLFFQSSEFSGPVALVDREGALLWTEPYDEARIAARPRIPAALRTSRPAVLHEPLSWRAGPAALLVQPILDLSGKSAGALLGEIDFETPRVAAFLREPQHAALLAEDGSVLGSTLPAGLLEALQSLPPREGTQTVQALGSSWLVARAQLERAPWSVLIVYPVAEAFAHLRTLQWRLLAAALLLAAAGVGVSLLVLNRLVRPVEVLTEAARGVPLGDFARPVPLGAPGELGDLVRAFVGMRDDLRATLRGLRDSEERFRRSIDSANDPIFAVDLATQRVLHANRRAAAAGIEPGAEFGGAIAEEDRPTAHDFVARVAGAGEGSLPQLRLASGLPVSVSASLVVHGGGSFVQLICRDLTERQKMERELVQAEKMSTLGMLSAGIVHEMNAPLGYIIANLEDAEVKVRGIPGQLHPMVEEALQGARSVAGIVRDLRLFASGGVAASTADLNESVRMAVRMAHHELRHRATVVTELGELPKVAGRATELSQVFLNLLINAAHAIEPGNAAEQRVTVATRALDGRCIATVSDTGAGIPAELLSRIFDAFVTTKPEGVGTGLGLAITRDIVQRAGGSIRVESSPGKGTTFTVELPMA
jgi:signal transduction histidine kinase/HAMP domain-containing protein